MSCAYLIYSFIISKFRLLRFVWFFFDFSLALFFRFGLGFFWGCFFWFGLGFFCVFFLGFQPSFEFFFRSLSRFHLSLRSVRIDARIYRWFPHDGIDESSFRRLFLRFFRIVFLLFIRTYRSFDWAFIWYFSSVNLKKYLRFR